MATLLTLPVRIQETIATYLLPPDAAVLALTCRTMRQHLGQGNQAFWYDAHRRTNPDLYQTKPLDPSEDYWAKAVRTFSGTEKWVCKVCMKDLTELERAAASGQQILVFGDRQRRYCVPCHLDVYVNAYKFAERFPEVPIPDPKTYELRRYNYIPVLRTSAAVRLVEKYYGTTYKVANNSELRFKSKWSLNRGKEEAEHIHQALMFMKEIYIKQYKHITPVLHPDEYYDMFVNSLSDFILTKPAKPEIHTEGNPSKKMAKEVMKVVDYLAEGYLSSWRRKKALKLVESFHFRLFGDPNSFQPGSLDHPDYFILSTRLTRHAMNGALLCHLRYKRGDPTDNDKEVLPNARCYWCLRAQKPEEREKSPRTLQWNDFDKNGVELAPAPKFIAHVLVHHQQLMWKRPKVSKDKELPPLRELSSTWEGATYNFKVLETPVDIDTEELEDIPQEAFRYRHRISSSSYFNWV
ncbi:hypothetical protein TWF730_000219 [Orbilia blumenaviensis]|uniref:F-box domain-containing protein n=1 Tax=Orbilia blumenaviensis TaxID=1796055 RepID=A0AAV9VKW3_9PEZI